MNRRPNFGKDNLDIDLILFNIICLYNTYAIDLPFVYFLLLHTKEKLSQGAFDVLPLSLLYLFYPILGSLLNCKSEVSVIWP